VIHPERLIVVSDPIALDIATRVARSVAQSALPDAPIVPDAAHRPNAQGGRARAAARVRVVTQRASRWADRLDPTHTTCPAASNC